MGFLEDRANVQGKVAIVAGGAGGLGRACALDLARAGAKVELCDRNAELLDRTVQDIARFGATVTGTCFDVRDAGALGRFMSEVAHRHGGRAGALVNVVGGTFRQLFVESNSRGWDALIRANFTWLLHAVQQAVPLLEGGGSIINLTSIEAHRAAPGFAVYGAMKAAVSSLTRTLAVELGPLGIRVNAIAPDHITTEGLDRLSGPGRAEAGDQNAPKVVPLCRQGTLEDIGNVAVFLASDLSSYITGATLHPDGGALASSGWWYWPGLGFGTGPGAPPAASSPQGES